MAHGAQAALLAVLLRHSCFCLFVGVVFESDVYSDFVVLVGVGGAVVAKVGLFVWPAREFRRLPRWQYQFIITLVAEIIIDAPTLKCHRAAEDHVHV